MPGENPGVLFRGLSAIREPQAWLCIQAVWEWKNVDLRFFPADL